jgi:hypothetical protein
VQVGDPGITEVKFHCLRDRGLRVYFSVSLRTKTAKDRRRSMVLHKELDSERINSNFYLFVLFRLPTVSGHPLTLGQTICFFQSTFTEMLISSETILTDLPSNNF